MSRLRDPRPLLLLLGLAASAPGCEAPAPAPGPGKRGEVPLPHIVDSGTGEWAGGWGRGMALHYETALDPTDVPRLRAEAESIWATHRAAAERAGVCTVQLRASEPERTVLVVPGTDKAVHTRRNYDFLVRRDAPGGRWRWLASSALPPTACPP